MTFNPNQAPTLKNEEEENFLLELRSQLDSFYAELQKKCAGKAEGEKYIKNAKNNLETLLKENYTPEVKKIVSHQHSEPSDDAFRKQLLDQVKEDLKLHMDMEEQGVEFID
jgi:hypothetical protein